MCLRLIVESAKLAVCFMTRVHYTRLVGRPGPLSALCYFLIRSFCSSLYSSTCATLSSIFFSNFRRESTADLRLRNEICEFLNDDVFLTSVTLIPEQLQFAGNKKTETNRCFLTEELPLVYRRLRTLCTKDASR